jgi:cytoskeletal protein RodZ
MEIGQELKAAREAMGLSLEEVEQATKIRRKYLQALENEQFDLLPGAVYAKAFLKNYARFLNLDVEETMEAYSRLFIREAPPRSPERSTPRRTKEPVKVNVPGKPRYWLYLAAFVVLIGMTISLFYGARGMGLLPPADRTIEETRRNPAQVPQRMDENNQTPDGQARTPDEQAVPDQTRTPDEQAVPDQTRTPDEQAVPDQTGVNLVLNVKSDRSWMRVIVDGDPAFQGEVPAGQSKNFEARDKIAVTLGNAGVVEVLLNEQNLGFLGGEGAVVYREFTPPQG